MDVTRLLPLMATVLLTALLTPGAVWGQFKTTPFAPDRDVTTGSEPRRDRLAARRPAAAPDVPTQITNQTDFGIPFQLDANAFGVREVQLFVSSDRGENWGLHEARRASGKGFHFSAPSDGEFWFAVRTVSKNARSTHQDPFQPELRVFVDTKLPELDLRVELDGSGRAHAEWLAEDANLVVGTFQLQYQEPGGDWKVVEVPEMAQQGRTQKWNGRTSWRVSRRVREIGVVADILDAAKNVRRIQKRVPVTLVAAPLTN